MKFNCIIDAKSQRLYAYVECAGKDRFTLSRAPVFSLMTLAEQLHMQKVFICVDRSTPKLGAFVRSMLDLGFEVIGSEDRKDLISSAGFEMLEVEMPGEEEDDLGSECVAVNTQFGEESTIGGFSDSEIDSDGDLDDDSENGSYGSSSEASSFCRLSGIPELCSLEDDADLSAELNRRVTVPCMSS